MTCRRVRVPVRRTAAGVVAIGLLVAAPLAAQVCLGNAAASPGWVALEYGRAEKDADLFGADAGWQLSRKLALFGDGNVTTYPSPDPSRKRLAIGGAYALVRSARFSVCVTPGIEGERISDLNVLRVPIGLSFGWATTFDRGLRRLGVRVEPFAVYSRASIGQFEHTSQYVSARAALVFGVRRLFVGLEHEQAFDADAGWHTLARVGYAFQ